MARTPKKEAPTLKQKQILFLFVPPVYSQYLDVSRKGTIKGQPIEDIPDPVQCAVFLIKVQVQGVEDETYRDAPVH